MTAPHTRRCSLLTLVPYLRKTDCSAYAEMLPPRGRWSRCRSGLLRIRGDDPEAAIFQYNVDARAESRWRWAQGGASQVGINPARAEQVVCLPRRSGVSWGQPRVCGADGVFAQWISVRGGASPRVRSGPRPADPTQHQHRINPARAEQVVALYCVPALASGTQYSIRSLQSP